MAKIELSDLFTTSNEREGIWYEPKVNGSGIGVEFKILGYASDENIISADVYSKEHEAVEKEKDPKKRAILDRDVQCKRIGACIVDCRPVEGNEVTIDGEPLVYSPKLVQKILYENIEIRADLFRATIDTSNFMKKKD